MAKGIVARKARDEYVLGYVSESIVLDTSDCYVQQHQAAECDINNIIARYERDGVIDHVNRYQGEYGDFTEVLDYRSSLDKVMEAEECFMSLPANIRKRFENDPGQFLDFVADESNRDEMIELGLIPLEKVNRPVANEAKAEAETAPQG